MTQTIEYGNLRIKQINGFSPAFRVYDSDEVEPHHLADVWLCESEGEFVFEQTWKPYLRSTELIEILSWMTYKNLNIKPT